MTGEPTHTASKVSCLTISIIIWKVKYITFHCQLFSKCYQQYKSRVFEKQKVTSVKNTHNFTVMRRKPTTKLIYFTVSKDEWNTKEGTCKSMKNALYVLQYAKKHLLVWSDVEQWKNQACSLNHCQVMLVWRCQSGRHH